jgi:hypothetical protein
MERVSLPDSVEPHDAADLWKNLGFSESDGQEGQDGPRPPNPVEEGGDVDPVGLDETEETGEEEAPADEGEEGEEQQTLPELADAPEFWNEEDRKAWLEADPRKMREIVTRTEKQRNVAVNEKTREAAEKVRTASEGAKQLLDLVQNSAQWWQANGAAVQHGLQGKWASVNWDDLAENNPAEHTRLKHLKDKDDAILAQVRAQGERDMQITQQRQEAELVDLKRAGHAVVAKEMPEHFADGKWEQSYAKLGEFLQKQGFSNDRINQIHEAPLIRMAMESMLYREAKAKASNVVAQRDTTTGKFTARTAPTRVQPGPARQPGNRQADLDRQAMEQLRKSRGQDQGAALRAFRNLS